MRGVVKVALQLTAGSPQIAQQIKAEAERGFCGSCPGVTQAQVEVGDDAGSGGERRAAGASKRVPGIKRVVAIASGKGRGVGKSTVSVNLACGLKHLGGGRWGSWIAIFTGRAFR